jgi:hypothetical protein
MTGMATKSSDDLAFEAMELIRKKNVHFRVQTKGQTWDCTFLPKDEQYAVLTLQTLGIHRINLFPSEKALIASSSSTTNKGSPTSSLRSGRSGH